MNTLVLLMDQKFLPIIIIVSLLAFFGLIVLIVILVKKHVKTLQIPKDEKKTEEELAKEELDRILVPIEDEEIKKAMSNEATSENLSDNKKD